MTAASCAAESLVLRNITVAKTAEEELRVRDEKNRTILATAHEAFIAIDEASKICEWNEEAEATFGWTQHEAIGRLLPETIIPPRFRDAHRQGVASFLATGKRAGSEPAAGTGGHPSRRP